MLPSEYYVESCTLFDDQYLVYHDLIEDKPESETVESKSQLNAGGFSYKIKNDYRFIIWRINGNQLELIEQSLVYKLNENCKRIIFKNSMIIPRIHIEKDFRDPSLPIIQILIATTFKLYRLTFKVQLNELATKSIFYNFTNLNLSDIDPSNSYSINLQQVDYGNIFVTPNGEAIFAYILQNNSVCCVQMSPVNKMNLYDRSSNQMTGTPNLPIKFELNQPSIVSRLWSGISRAAQDSQPIIISYRLFYMNETTYLIGLCKDLKIRIFCLKSNQCIHAEDLVKHVKLENPVIWEESMLDMIAFTDNAIFSVVLTSLTEFKVCNLNIEIHDANVRISQVSKKIVRKKGKLVNVHMSRSKVWLMYKNEKESIEIVTIAIDENNMSLIYLEESHLSCQDKEKLMISKQDEYTDDEENDYEEDELINFDCSKTDIKERYLKLIFEPYRFSKTNIYKALGVLTNSTFNESRLPKNNNELKKLIIQSIESEVQNHPNFGNVTEEEFLFLNSKCWLKFFTMLKQYDYDSRIPIGLYIDPENESIISLIRKNAISVYNYADISQYNNSSQMESVRTFLNKNAIMVDDDHQPSDLLHLVVCIQELCSSLKVLEFSNPDITGYSTESAEVQLSNINTINNLTDNLIFADKNFLTEICNHLNKISSVENLVRAIQMIIMILERDSSDYDVDLDQSESMDVEFNMGSAVYLRSEFTMNFVLSSFYHKVQRRCEFLRSLTILINIIRRCYENLDISREASDEINMKYFETIITCLNGYEYLKWLNAIYPSFVSKQELNNNARRVMDLIDSNSEENMAEIKQTTKYDNFLIKSFIQSSANKKIFDINNIASNNKNLMRFNEIADYLLLNVFRIIWPLNRDDSLGLIKYLLLNGQYIHLNNYCLATKWMQKGKSLRYFLLGNCCLFFNNIDQSIDLFLKASRLINNDALLKKLMKLVKSNESVPVSSHANLSMPTGNRRKSINITKGTASRMDSSIFNSTSNIEMFDKLLTNQAMSHKTDDSMEDNNDKILLDYYIKIIHYYDLNGDIEAAIELVQNALLMFQFDAKSKSTLYCVLFKSYMSLEYYEKAHASIISNIDLEWKQICLKHFISELCNQNKTSQLVSFDYGDLHQDVLKILYERANRSDLRTHDYYNIIYSLHLKHNDYLSAAYCMLESATRLKKELSGLQSLKRQEKCYLACLNVLKLVDKKYAWISRPVTTNDNTNKSKIGMTIQDRNEIKDNNIDMQIIDRDEINKNYMAIYYMIKLSTINQNQSNTANFYSTDEIISLLIKFGLFDDAVIASSLFKNTQNPMDQVFIGLVDRCCAHDNNEKDVFQSEFDFSKNNDSIECYSPYENPADFRWRLLISYLIKFNDTFYYKIVAKRLLKNGYEIPSSIAYLFKKLDPNALLKIYIDFNFWEECVEIISEQIDQAIHKEDQNMYDEDSTSSNKLSTFSYNSIDKILYVLSKSKEISEKGSVLKQKLSEYISQIKISSESIIKSTNA